MCEQTEVRYLDGDVVWVKLGSCWWPGSVKDVDQLPEEILVSLKKKPIAAVKFFQEETFEYVRNLNQICMYNCRRKNEFIKKGLDIYRTRRREGSSVMDKFPDDVSTAEKLTGGDPDILRDEAFAPEDRPDYRNIFGGDNKRACSPDKKNKSISPKVNWKVSSANGRRSQTLSPALNVLQQPRQITHPRFISEVKDDSDHVVRIRQQPSSTPSRDEQGGTPIPQYKCHQCDFTSNRLNVIVLHNKFHTADAANNGRGASNKGGSTIKSKSAECKVGNRGKSRISPSSPSDRSRARSKTVPATNETPTRAESAVDRSAPKRKLVDASENEKTKEESSANSKSQSPKTPEKQFKPSEKKTPKMPIFGKRKITKGSSDKPAKKKKNDEEIREKLLADWDEEDEEQEEKEIELIKQELSKSELCSSPSTNLTPSTPSTMGSSQSESTPETKEETTKPKITSCFDFDDSEDANLGIELEERAKKFVENRKIPRILEDKSEPVISKRRSITDDIKPIIPSESSNSKIDESEPSVAESLKEELDLKKTDETLSAVPDTEDMDVAFKTLLDETTVPALPEVPELPIAKVASPPPEVGSSASLPDIVLDSNNSETNSSTSCLPEVTSVENTGGGDHDYSIKTEIEIVEEQPMKTETEENLNLPKEDVSEQIEEPAQAPIDDDEMELDINSMPVVMTDAIITDEPESKSPVVSMPMADLIPKTEPSEPFVLSEYKPNIATASTLVTTVASIVSPATPPETVVAVSKSTVVVSTQIPSSSGSSVVKAPIKTVKLQAATSSTAAALSTIGKLKGTGGATVLSQKGPGGGKLVIVQAPPGQQSRYTVGKSAQQRVTVKAAQQQIVQQGVGGGKVVILTKSQTGGQQKILTAALSPQQQRILATSGKLQSQTQPQRIISSTGAILTPINPRSVMAKGTKLTPITQQQMRALQGGKQTLGAKFTMQSTQAKVILPSMQKATVSQTSPVRVIGTLKPQTNTILIQTTQGTTVSGTVVAKSVASTSGQIQPKITTTQTIAKLANSKPKILASSGVASTIQRISIPTTLTGKTIQTTQGQQKVVGIRTAVAPRMVMQKIQSPVAAKVGSVGLLTNVSQVKKVSGLFQRASPQKITQPGNQTQILHKIGTTQSVQKIVTPQQLKKTTITQQKVADVSVQGSKCIPIVVSATNLQANAEAVTTQPLPSLQPLQPNVTVAPAMQSSNLPLSSSHSNVTTSIPGALPSLQPASTTTPVLMSEQIAQVVAATPAEQLGDGSTATYVLVTIDDSGALQPYENSTLLSYDGGSQTSEGAARTLYIDPSSISSSGDLENIILTIDNSASNSGAVLNLGQTNALPVSPATTIAVENSTSSVFNIGPSHASAPQSSSTNQDILAEALANTQVFQPDNTIQDSLTVVNSNQSTVMTPRLLEPSILTSTPSTLHQTAMLLPSLSTVLPPPTNPAGVLETSLTLNQPIMTPLEVPSSVVPTLQAPPPIPSSLELPLTITQPALSVTSQSYPSLPATTPSRSSTPSSSLSLTAPVSAGSFNPSMPLLSEETDSQTEININIGEQQSVIPPMSVSEQVQSHEDIIYNEDIGSTVQEKASSHVETLLTSAQAAQSQSTLSYENTSENAPLEKEPISKDSLELDQSSSTSYQKSDLVNAEPQVEEPTLTSDQQVSLLVENNRTDGSIEQPTSAPNGIQAGVSDQCYSNTDHSSSDHIDPGHNSLNNIGFNNVENPSPLEGPTPASETLFTESSGVPELAIQQKSDVDQPSYESSTDDSQLQINNDSARAEETSENDSYLPVSDNTVSAENTVAASNSSDQNPCNIFLEVADDSRVVQTESNNLNPYSGVQDNVSESLSDNSESQQPITNVSSQSMPLLVDEPMTETDVEEKSSLKEPEPALNNDVEMSLEQNERSKDQGSLSQKPIPCQVLHDVERSDSDDDLPPALSPPPLTSQCDKQKVFSKDDVVWVRCDKMYWPAVITNVDKKTKKAYIKTVNSPRKARSWSVSFRTLISFDDGKKNKELLEKGKKTCKHLQTAYDKVKYFYVKKQEQRELSAVRYLTFDPDDKLYGTLNSSKDSRSSTNNEDEEINWLIQTDDEEDIDDVEDGYNEDRRIDKEVYEQFSIKSVINISEEKKKQRRDNAIQLLKIIKTKCCFNHLKKIYYGKKVSTRHNNFMSGNLKEKFSLKYFTGIELFPSGELEHELIKTLQGYIETLGMKNDWSNYMYFVLLPEAILYALKQDNSITVTEGNDLIFKIK